MTTRWEDKDPADVVTVEFDFSDSFTTLSGTPTIAVTLLEGTDASPSAILLGGVTVVGAIVRQRITGGVSGALYGLQCTGTDGSNTITIEALLPVRARPIAATFTARYLTEAQFERRFGHSELVDLQSTGNTFGQAETEAASLIDGFLAAKYVLPLAHVPPMLQGWAADIVRFKLWDERAPDEVRRRYEDAIAQLKMVAQGTIALPPDAAGTPAETPTDYEAECAERVFTSETLACF
jgi:phage gp36-like protein